MQAMTRAQMRDAIRLEMGLPIAKSRGGNVGDPAKTHPRPTNDLINQKLDDALSMIARESGFSVVSSLTQAVSAQTANGAYSVSLWSFGVPTVKQGSSDQVRRVSWYNGETWEMLTPSSREAMDRDNRDWDNTPPSVPQWWWVEGNNLFIAPAPEAAGTLKINAGVGVMGYDTDNAFIEELPATLLPAVRVVAVQMIGLSDPTDPEMQALAAGKQTEVQYWLNEARKLRIHQSGQHQMGFAVYSYRRGGARSRR
jgi:hypothetical protein